MVALAFRTVTYKAALLVLSLVFFSCAAKLPYSLNYPLTQETFRSHDGSFVGLIPQGWFSASEDTLAAAQLAWLVKEDFSAVLTVHELHLDRLTLARVQKEGLALLGQISLSMHADDLFSSVIIQPKEFSMSGKNFCGYEVKDNIGQKRIVVFSVNGKFYESEAVPVKGMWKPEETEKLFMAQQAFLSTLAF